MASVAVSVSTTSRALNLRLLASHHSFQLSNVTRQLIIFAPEPNGYEPESRSC
jgi:hypothetical protein